MKIRFDINDLLLKKVNEYRSAFNMSTSEALNLIIDFYFVVNSGADYLKEKYEED